ncbi:MAG: hypothetical protein ABI592_10445 [Acidobacteriota bacterium]
MKTASFILLVVLTGAPAARWLQKTPACCPLAGKGMACCPSEGAPGGCRIGSCSDTFAAFPAAASLRAALPPSRPGIVLSAARVSLPAPPDPAGFGVDGPPVPPPRG